MKRIIRIALLVVMGVVLIGTFVYLYVSSRPKKVTYQIEEVVVRDIRLGTIATGKISPRNEVDIKPQISGIIKAVYKEAGDMVKAGDVVALVQVIPEMSTLSSAESQEKMMKMELDQAQVDFDRSAELYAKKVISTEDYERAQLSLNRAKENYQNAVDYLEITRDGIAKRSGSYSNTQIRATISGMILDVPVKVGNSVIQSNNFNDGTTICTLADMSDMIFKGNIDESEVGRLQVGMPILLTIGAMRECSFPATLEYISPKGTESNGAVLFEIRAAAQIPDSVVVRAGYSANAEIVLKERLNVVSVPENTIQFEDDTTFVYLLTSDDEKEPVFERQAVETGMSDGVNIEIVSGLEVGNKVRGNKNF